MKLPLTRTVPQARPSPFRPAPGTQPCPDPRLQKMYRCERCQQVQPAGTPTVMVPVQTRPRSYPAREDAHPGLPRRGKNGRKIPTKHLERRPDPGGHGQEIVRELRCCPTCAARLQAP